MNDMVTRPTIILPAKNEEAGLRQIIPELKQQWPDAEILVVDDGSTDGTAAYCEEQGIACLRQPYSIGNGAAIKAGARHAKGDILIFMDADGQHQVRDIRLLIEKFQQGYDMVVGARIKGSHASGGRAVANTVFNQLASWMVGHPIPDLTCGFRIVDAAKFRRFLYLLPNGFSYPTTITMSFFRAGYAVGYVDIHTPERIGNSHIRPFRDGMRFLLIIFKIGSLYSPLKLFFPISASFFLLGLGYYLLTYYQMHRLTNMSVLLFVTAVLVFLIGIVSEQITMLNYRDSDR